MIAAMKVTIYRIPGSHPCEAVIKAAELKGIDHKVVDLLAASQPVVMTMMFGGRTVPAIKIKEKGKATQKVQGTSKCLRALDALVPEPPLYPSQAGKRERVLTAEAWGVGEFQNLARRIVWKALTARKDALASFNSGIMTKVPDSVLPAVATPSLWVERKMNGASDNQVREDLEKLPGYLDEIDDFIAAGVIGGEEPNAGDLAVLSNIWLLRSMDDLKPMLDARPAGRKSKEIFGDPQGFVPAGAFPAAWLTEVNAARGAATPA